MKTGETGSDYVRHFDGVSKAMKQKGRRREKEKPRGNNELPETMAGQSVGRERDGERGSGASEATKAAALIDFNQETTVSGEQQKKKGVGNNFISQRRVHSSNLPTASCTVELSLHDKNFE